MTYYITADTHFNHFRICDYCNRPFTDIDHMNETLINNWNDLIKPEDNVYFLGDFCFGKPEKFLSRLNGHITFIKGNHDRSRLTKTIGVTIGFENKFIFLCHDPVTSLISNERYVLCAHVHELWRKQVNGKKVFLNVGVDVWDFKPILLETALNCLVKGMCP